MIKCGWLLVLATSTFHLRSGRRRVELYCGTVLGYYLFFISYYDVPREIGCKFVPLKQSHRTLERSHCVIWQKTDPVPWKALKWPTSRLCVMMNCLRSVWVALKFLQTFFCSKLFHVRSVTQGDVIRADAKDIPRIFQVCTFALNSWLLQCLFHGEGYKCVLVVWGYLRFTVNNFFYCQWFKIALSVTVNRHLKIQVNWLKRSKLNSIIVNL